jgi:hypothetical protein
MQAAPAARFRRTRAGERSAWSVRRRALRACVNIEQIASGRPARTDIERMMSMGQLRGPEADLHQQSSRAKKGLRWIASRPPQVSTELEPDTSTVLLRCTSRGHFLSVKAWSPGCPFTHRIRERTNSAIALVARWHGLSGAVGIGATVASLDRNPHWSATGGS